MMRINNDAEVQVYILVTEVTDQNLRELQDAGVRIELQDKRQRIVQARIPVTRLEEVGALPFVRFVRLPDYGVRQTGSVDTQGDAILKADQVRSMLGVDGTGVRVGVISDGINGIFATGCTTCDGVSGGPIATDDLPSATGTRNASGVLTSVSGGITARSFRSDGDLEGHMPGCVEPGCGAEGTAMLEIVHDLAPGAQLSFANADTSLEFPQAVNWLAANTDVVVDDIGFFGMPYDGTSAVSTNTANALNNSANPVRAYFTAVGNSAREHYQGVFVDSGTDGTPFVGLPGDLHLFQPTADTSDVLGLGSTVTDQIHLPAGAAVVVSLIWNDPFGASNNDYDLFLLRSGIFGCLNFPDVVAWSIAPQNGTQDPVEVIEGYINNTGADDDFCIVIQNSQNLAAPRTFDMFILRAPPLVPWAEENHNYNTVSSSVPAQSDAGGSPVSVISVAAINQADSGNDDIEYFSSNGPTNDGRMKPDVTAIDGVSVTGAGGFGSSPPGTFPQTFFGTSAAAPHGAGVATLLLQAAPCLRAGATGALGEVNARTNLRNLTLNNAVDLGTAGPDNVFGYGRIDALAAANQTIPTANAGPTQTVNGTSSNAASATLNGTASSDPYGCPLTFSWTGTCGNASGVNPTVTCPFGTNNETLTVTNNGVTLSQAASVQITVTNFAISASPSSASVSPGRSATYTLSVNPQYGAFTNAVSLACSNLPLRSTCSFSPSSVTPGASGATSNLTISTTAPSASFKDPFGPPPLYGLWIGLMALSLIALAGIRRFARTRARALYVSAGLLGLFLALLAACGGGGGGGGGPTNPGTPAGTYTVTIAGTAGSLQNSGTVTLIVQ
jgi:hypothetical protein